MARISTRRRAGGGGGGVGAEAEVDDLVEVEGGDGVGEAAAGAGEAGELADEERAALGLAGDALRERVGGCEAEVVGREGAGLGLGEGADRQRVHLHVVAGAEAGEQAHERGSGGVGAVVVAAQEGEGGGVRAQEDGLEQLHAVEVGPLEVVEDEHERALAGDGGEELGEGVGGLAADLDGVDVVEVGVVLLADLRHGAEDREQAGERGDRRGELAGVVAEVDGELVEGGVEGLEGDRLALGAVAGEDEGVVLAAGEVGDVLDDGGLAVAGAAADRGEAGAAGAGGEDDRAQGLGLAGAADEAAGDDLDGDEVGAAEAGEHGGGVGARGGVAGEKLAAQALEVGGDGDAGAAGRERVGGELALEHLVQRSVVAHAAGEALPQDLADGVPVGGGADGVGVDDLLRGHVERGADDRGAVERGGPDLADEAEVEDDDAAALGDHHVGGLDVAVDQAVAVDAREAAGEADQEVLQAVEAGGVERLQGLVVVAGGGHEVLAAQALHGEEDAAQAALVLDLQELVELDEVGVDDAAEGAKLAFEAVEALGAGLADELEGDDGAVGGAGLEHGAHAADAEEAEDRVVAGGVEAEVVAGVARGDAFAALGDRVAGVLRGELEAGLAGDEVAGDGRCEADAIVKGWRSLPWFARHDDLDTSGADWASTRPHRLYAGVAGRGGLRGSA